MSSSRTALDRALANEEALLSEWVQLQLATPSLRSGAIRESELRAQAREFISLFRQAIGTGSELSPTSQAWSATRDFIDDLSRSRAHQGFSPSETATFILSLKEPLFAQLRDELASSPGDLVDAFRIMTEALDRLALLTTEAVQKGREEIIHRQQQELLELSTPVVELWSGILALPLVGTLDSARTQIVMESLLQAIVRTSAAIAIIDITGVPAVDTMVAQHLLKTVAAARLMGADCIISGIRSQTAQTIVHLGVDLATVSTKATLADAFSLALRKSSSSISRS